MIIRVRQGNNWQDTLEDLRNIDHGITLQWLARDVWQCQVSTGVTNGNRFRTFNLVGDTPEGAVSTLLGHLKRLRGNEVWIVSVAAEPEGCFRWNEKEQGFEIVRIVLNNAQGNNCLRYQLR